MTHEDRIDLEEKIATLDAVLDRERAAILKGELDKLPCFLAEKENLMPVFSDKIRYAPAGLEALERKVKRNQDLIRAAMDGIKSVVTRMAALREMRGMLKTYGSDGKMQNIEVRADSSVEKRA